MYYNQLVSGFVSCVKGHNLDQTINDLTTRKGILRSRDAAKASVSVPDKTDLTEFLKKRACVSELDLSLL